MTINLRTSLIIVFFFATVSPLPSQADAEDGSPLPLNNSAAMRPASGDLVTWGTIDSVTPNQIVIRDENRETNEFILTDRTQFAGISRDDLQLGTDVTIQYEPGDDVADVVAVKQGE